MKTIKFWASNSPRKDPQMSKIFDRWFNQWQYCNSHWIWHNNAPCPGEISRCQANPIS